MALPEDSIFEILDLPMTNETPKKDDINHTYRKISLLVHLNKIIDKDLKLKFTVTFTHMLRSLLLDFSLTYQ